MTPAYIDRHSVEVAAGPEAVWRALRSYVGGLGFPEDGTGARVAKVVWAPDPPSGFRVVAERPGEEIVLEGSHRFSRYRLVFGVDDGPGRTTRLTATSYGDFPGPHGAAYRALVVGTRAHRLAVRGMLATVASRAAGQA